MFKGICKYVQVVKRHRVAVVLIIGMVLLFKTVPVFADAFLDVTVKGIPNFGNSPPSLTTLASSGYMDGTGTKATLTGSLDSLSIFPNADIWFEWGYNGNYNNTVGLQTVGKLGIYTQEITGFNPTETINFRFVGGNLDGTRYGEGLVLQMREDALLSGYRLVSFTPFLFVVTIIIGLVAIMRGGFGIVAIVSVAVLIYMGIPLLEGLQGFLRAMWGG